MTLRLNCYILAQFSCLFLASSAFLCADLYAASTSCVRLLTIDEELSVQSQELSAPQTSRYLKRLGGDNALLAKKIEQRLKIWGDAPSIYAIRYSKDSDPTFGIKVLNKKDLPPHVERQAADHFGADQMVIDNKSPHFVKVYRGLNHISLRQFDPDKFDGQCVASSLCLVTGYSGQDTGESGVIVEYTLPAFLLEYNRNDYVLRYDTLNRYGVKSFASLITRVATVDSEGRLKWQSFPLD